MIRPGDKQVNVHDAKTHLSRLLARVEAGEEVVIARNGKPVAKLTRVESPQSKRLKAGWARAVGKRGRGFAKGKFTIREDFDDPLPDDLLRAFYDNPIEPD